MSVTYESRLTYIQDLPVAEGFEVLRPEQVVVRFSNGRTIDVGALCYTKHSPASRTRANNGSAQVVLSSFTSTRVSWIRKLIGVISEELGSALSLETLRDRYSRFSNFIHWADDSGWVTVLDGRNHARAAFAAYVTHLRDRVARNEITINSGAWQQTSALSTLEALMDIEDLSRGLNLLRMDGKTKQSTSPPDEQSQGRVLELCTLVFSGLSHLVLGKKAYPFSLHMPKYLAFPGDSLWVFPTTQWIKTPEMQRAHLTMKHQGCGYNYARGRPTTLEELRSQAKLLTDDTRKRAINMATHQISVTNQNINHPQRLAAGVVALKCFLMLFLAQTGMNWAQLITLTWDDDFVVETTNQGFRTIKRRAGGKTVSFELPVTFMPFFRRYLDLRKFLLQGRTYNRLFFGLGVHGGGAARAFQRSASTVYKTLYQLDPSLSKIMPRQWRAAKADWLLRYTDVATAALVLQNTEKTVLKSYAEGSESLAMEEMGAFLTSVSQTVLNEGTALDDSIKRAVGKCTDYGEPVPQPDAAITPDCRGPEGCLFCEKFKLHADETDTRKLLSCRYCLQQTTSAMGSEERLQRLVTPVIQRIDVLLAEISTRNTEMVKAITREVDEEGELDPYWARKLDMLTELGLTA